jgi:thiamine-phosphate pyrophosphorylase
MLASAGVFVAATDDSCRLYLVVETGAGAAERAAAALAVADAACLLIEPVQDAPLDTGSAKPLVALAQAKDVAAIIAADAHLARTLKADGVHLPPSREPAKAYADARHILGQGFIVGAHAGKSRDAAMVLGEAGADYIGFGIPADITTIEGARARRLDLVSWWATIFEVPCVAFDVATPEDAEQLARAGAEFIGVRLEAGESLADAAARIRAIADAIGVSAPAR